MPSLNAGHKTIDRRKNRRTRARDNRKQVHVAGYLPPVIPVRTRTTTRSVYQEYKPLHRPRHITRRNS